MAEFKQMSKEEKIKYGKQFSSKERKAYRKGKRNGWLERYHETKNQPCGFKQRTYTKAEIGALFDNFKDVKW